MQTLPGYHTSGILYESAGTTVWRATRVADGVPVVVKMPTGDPPDLNRLARWRYEHEVLSGLSLRGVVRCFGLVYDHSRPALILEDIGGVSLRSVLGRCRAVERFLPIAIALAETLSHLHDARIIHKDINPNNIVYNEETGELRLIDFGIASRLPRENEDAKNPGLLEGTLRYISPEQTGRMNRAIDHRSDLYSLGVTFYEMLTGEAPFRAGDAMELVHCHLAKEAVPPSELRPELPPALSEVIRKLLAKTPEQRYQSAFGLLHDLRRLQRGETSFLVGERDVSPYLLVPQRLFGREADLQLVQAAFARVVAGGSELLLISGYSGIGKSSLVNELQRPVALAGGYFLCGKFDQFRRDIPYDAVVQALRQLLRQLLLEGPVRVEALRTRCVEALGLDAHALIELAPELELLLGKPAHPPELGPAEAEARRGEVLGRFLGIFAAMGRPLVLFLDDLQWVDAASLRLLRALADRDKTQLLLLVLAYRDNEITEGHPLPFVLAEIERTKAIATSAVTLTSLATADVSQLLGETFHRPQDEVAPLAAILQSKTHGNPFFLNQLLTTLYREKLLTFRHDEGRWHWEVAAIAQAEITDNVVELMIARIAKLSPRIQELLQLASCIGARFELSVIAAIDERPAAETASSLWEALADGLLVPVSARYRSPETFAAALGGGEVEYRFLHDRVQQSAYAMIPGTRRKATRLRIGRLLLRHLTPAALEDRLFDVVGHLLFSRELLQDAAERAAVAELALRAGKKAHAALAYDAAVRLLRGGLSLLAQDLLTTHRELAFASSLELSQCEYLRGSFAEAEHLFKGLFEQAVSNLERAEVYRVRIVLYENASRFDEAIHCGFECLRLFGVELDEVPSEAAVGAMIHEAMTLLGGRPIHELLHAPVLSDPERAALFQVLLSLVAAAYFRGPTVFCAVVTQMVLLSMRHGNSPFSAAAYVYFGVVMASLGQHAVGFEFGRLAFDLLSKYDAPPIRGKVTFMFGNWLNFRRHHVATDVDHLIDAFQMCIDAGDLTYACYCCIGVVQVWFVMGKNLAEAHREAPRWLGFARKIKAMDIVDNITTVDRAFCALLGIPPEPGAHPGPESDVEFEARLERERSMPVQAYQHHHQSLVRYILEDYGEAYRSSCECDKRKGAMSGQMLVEEHAFHQSLILAALIPAADEPSRTAHLQQIHANRKVLADIAEQAPMNYGHKRLLIDAELRQLGGDLYGALELYDESIAAALASGYIHHAAIASELAGRLCLQRGKLTHARAYLSDALRGYAQWGAAAKVQQLGAKHRRLLGDLYEVSRTGSFHDASTSTSTSTSQGSGLDMLTVIKASQTISRELKLGPLLQQLTRIVLENAGAERGYLILGRGDSLVIAAAGEAARDTVLLGEENSPEGALMLASAVVQHVARSAQTVILDDALSDPTYGSDPYIRDRKVRSVLCMPAISLGHVAAIVYLENNLTAGCFTVARLEVLKVLSTQIAISLDHATLYESLEDKVRERTDELRATQARLLVLERLETERQMAGGFAHEVRNALAGPQGLLAQVLGDEGHPSLPCKNAGRLQELFSLFQPTATPAQLESLKAILLEVLDNEEHLEKVLTLVRGSVSRVLLITQQILEYARTGEERAGRTAVAINQLAGELASELEHGLKERRIRLESRLDPRGPHIHGRESSLHSVLANLLYNARDAVSDRPQDAVITLATEQSEGGTWLSVEDNGVGIPPENLERIFEPFFSTKPQTGTGLGLSLVKKIVSLSGGKITVDSQPGRGTKIALFFPEKTHD